MDFNRPNDVKAIRMSLRVGHVYLTFSGDDDFPYRFGKIVSIEGNNLWLKLFYDKFKDEPASFDLASLPGGFRLIPASIDMFLALGPPKFPIYVCNEAVTEEELDGRSPF